MFVSSKYVHIKKYPTRTQVIRSIENDRHVNPERSFGGTNGEPPSEASEASELRKGGPGVFPRKISKTYIANGAIYVIPELYL